MRAIDEHMIELRAAGLELFWFVRKPPGLRLRFGGALTGTIGHVLADILIKACDEGSVVEWFASAYEPETHDLGGPEAIEAAHRYFAADTRLYLERERLLREGVPLLNPATLSLAVLSDLFARATGDHGEAWDVWCNLGRIYQNIEAPAVALGPVSLAMLKERVGAEEAALLAGYEAANTDYAAEMERLWRRGALLWGRRAILPSIAAFVWNRHAVPGPTIAACVRAMTAAASPKRGLVGVSPEPVL